MMILKVGEKFPPAAGYGEGVITEFDEAGMVIVLNYPNPSEKEKAAVKSGAPFELRFTEIDNIIMFCTKCGELSWSDSPYNVFLSRNPQALQQIPCDAGVGIALTLILVDARNNTIQNVRVIGLENKFSQSIYDAVQRQKQNGFLLTPQYDTLLSEIYKKYTIKELVQRCSARFKLR